MSIVNFNLGYRNNDVSSEIKNCLIIDIIIIL